MNRELHELMKLKVKYLLENHNPKTWCNLVVQLKVKVINMSLNGVPSRMYKITVYKQEILMENVWFVLMFCYEYEKILQKMKTCLMKGKLIRWSENPKTQYLLVVLRDVKVINVPLIGVPSNIYKLRMVKINERIWNRSITVGSMTLNYGVEKDRNQKKIMIENDWYILMIWYSYKRVLQEFKTCQVKEKLIGWNQKPETQYLLVVLWNVKVINVPLNGFLPIGINSTWCRSTKE